MQRRKKESERGGGLAPKTKLKIGPDRRAQAVLRAAERPKQRQTSQAYGRRSTITDIRNPGVGIVASKNTISTPGKSNTRSDLEFNRYKPGKEKTDPYSTKSARTSRTTGVNTAHSLHKDRLRSAAVKHAMGRQLSDVRSGHRVSAGAILSPNGRNPRGRAYEQQTNGALNFERGKSKFAESTKLSKDTWQPRNTETPVKFNPNTLKNALKAMAQTSVVRATSKLIGGPVAQAAVMLDDAVAAATRKRPSREIAKQHSKTQSKLIDEIQKRKEKQAPWVGSGPF